MEVLGVEWTYPYPIGPERNTERFVYMRPDRRACSLERIISSCVNLYFGKGVTHFRVYHMVNIRYPPGITGASRTPSRTRSVMMAGKLRLYAVAMRMIPHTVKRESG